MMVMVVGVSLFVQVVDVVKVGFLIILSGLVSVFGVDECEGFMLVMKMLGNKFGGVFVEVIVVDDQFSFDVVKQGVDCFIKCEKVDILSGFVYFNILLVVVFVVFVSKIVVVSVNVGLV